MKYKDKIFEGYHFPDSPINENLKVTFSLGMRNKYIPEIEKIEMSKGLRLLLIAMTQKEGFLAPSKDRPKGSKSYQTNNPGNIGNTDSGDVRIYKNINEGIKAQIDYINNVANGMHSAYKFGKKVIKPFYSKEIAKNQKTYGIEPYLPGYNFNYTGQLGAFVKIYSTGARAGNGYLSMIISFFKQNGITITEDTTLKEILQIN